MPISCLDGVYCIYGNEVWRLWIWLPILSIVTFFADSKEKVDICCLFCGVQLLICFVKLVTKSKIENINFQIKIIFHHWLYHLSVVLLNNIISISHFSQETNIVMLLCLFYYLICFILPERIKNKIIQHTEYLILSSSWVNDSRSLLYNTWYPLILWTHIVIQFLFYIDNKCPESKV